MRFLFNVSTHFFIPVKFLLCFFKVFSYFFRNVFFTFMQSGVVLSISSGQASSQQASSQTSNYRPVGAANSLIRQLLQTSPQYSHLLSDLEPICAGGGGGSPGGTLAEAKSTGSPRSTPYGCK